MERRLKNLERLESCLLKKRHLDPALSTVDAPVIRHICDESETAIDGVRSLIEKTRSDMEDGRDTTLKDPKELEYVEGLIGLLEKEDPDVQDFVDLDIQELIDLDPHDIEKMQRDIVRGIKSLSEKKPEFHTFSKVLRSAYEELNELLPHPVSD